MYVKNADNSFFPKETSDEIWHQLKTKENFPESLCTATIGWSRKWIFKLPRKS